MVVVKLQHRSHLMQASAQSLGGNGGLRLGGSDASYEGEIRTRESSSIWDEEW